MPSVFKALATIAVWVLFIFGLLRLAIGLVMAFTSGPEQAAMGAYLDFAVGVGSLILSVVAMRLRQAMK
jgi:hypothetical protein